MPEFFEFSLGTRLAYGAGLVAEIGGEVQRTGGAHVFIVTDAGVQQAGLLDPVIAGLGNSAELVGLYDAVPPNSSLEVVEEVAARASEAGADLVLAVGGGSPIDTAKAVRILMTEGGQLLDYEGYNLLTRQLVPMIAIPTTAGTGSEVTNFAVIRNERDGRKVAFQSAYLYPDVALLDPEMTRTMPPRLTAATGIDALSHAIEGFVATNSSPFTDCLALYAIDLISSNLRAATYTPDDLEARGNMLIASAMAGVTFSNSWVGVVHALAHAVGGQFPVHHGTANAILLPHGMRYNVPAASNRYSRIARAMGVPAGGRAEADVIADGIAAVCTLAADCGLPLRLRDVGVPAEALDRLADIAMGDASHFNNPRSVTTEALHTILVEAW